MINPMQQFRPDLRWLAAALLLGVGVPSGCGEDPPPPPAKKRARAVPKAPPPPAMTSIEELMATHNIDPRVLLSEDDAPSTDPQRIAILGFFDGFATGSPDRIAPLLKSTDREELELMVASGDLAAISSQIEEIEVISGTTPEGVRAYLAIYWLPNRADAQMWLADETSGTLRFEAAPAVPGIAEYLGQSPFEDWFAVVNGEMLQLSEPDLGLLAIKARRDEEHDAQPPDRPSPPSGGGGPRSPGL